jgi:ribosome maturation factor RimP
VSEIEAIEKLIEPILDGHSVDLVELQLLGRGSRTLLRVYIEEKGGVSLGKCEKVSRAISEMLDRKDSFASHYVLEVSSPGLDRPLKTVKDFQRKIGECIEMTMTRNQSEEKIVGIIDSVHDQAVSIRVGKEMVRCELESIKLAKLVIKV